MTKDPSHPTRAFFAIALPDEVKQKLQDLIVQLKKVHPARSIRWAKPHNLHVTLQFIEAVQPDDLKKLIQNVGSEMCSCKAFELEFQEIELFPTPYLPHIISIKVGPEESTAKLAQ